jgi:ABC-type glycerol-3-phosphate transport system substrate-binding protein
MKLWRRRLSVWGLALPLACLAAALVSAGCKEYINPHVTPEGDVELMVARTASLAGQSRDGVAEPASSRIVITVNNAPQASRPFEQELAQREVELFESRNPGIRVEYSMWQFTPESFLERARSRTLTDVIEVTVDQMVPIVDQSYAADITANAQASPEFQRLNPEVIKLTSRDGRVYGVPKRLHTMALFYNRSLVAAVASEAKASTAPVEASKAKGADGEAREYLGLPTEPVTLAQTQDPRGRTWYDFTPDNQPQRSGWRPPTRTQQPQDSAGRGPSRQGAVRRGEQQVRDFYNLPQWQTPENRAYESYYDVQDAADARPRSAADTESAARGPRRQPWTGGDPQSDFESAAPFPRRGIKIDDDVLTAGMSTAQTPARPEVTTVVETFKMPEDWDSFIRLAAKLTDHRAGVYGYAPVLFAEEGGREFAQWGIQAGLQLQTASDGKVATDVNTPAAAEVARFLKDLRWRYDVTPPLDRCYYDNVLRMFAGGSVAMVMLPADLTTLERLRRLGMNMDDLGIAPLPGGPVSRLHLVSGRCLIVNSQLDRARRDAAFKWIMFQHDPERLRMREQYLFGEREITGVPSVPLYVAPHQERVYEMLRLYRSTPLFPEYEQAVARLLWPEPPYAKSAFYEMIAAGVRPIVERKDSVPEKEIQSVAEGFADKYLTAAPASEGLQRYLRQFVGR